MSSLIWLHEEALSLQHPVFAAAPPETTAVFVWDEAYFQSQSYSLKRLVFIYECVAALNIERVAAQTEVWLQQATADTIYVPASNNPWVCSIIQSLATVKSVQVIAAPVAFSLQRDKDHLRFFPFWREVEKNLS